MTHYTNSSNRSTHHAMGWLAVGAILGWIGGLLFIKGKRKTADEMQVWAKELYDQVAVRASQAKQMTKEAYEEMVDRVAEQYEKARHIRREDIQDIINELKNKWDEISQRGQAQS